MPKSKKTKLLFVCSANLDRSPVAADLFKDSSKYEAKSCGLFPWANTQLTKAAVEWADIIFVMDDAYDQHKTQLLERFPEAAQKDIIILGVPNIYTKNNPELVKVLKREIRKWIDF